MLTPNSPDPVTTANDTTAVPTMDSIAEKMTAMRNHVHATRETATGTVERDAEATAPAVPEGSEDETGFETESTAATEEDDAQHDDDRVTHHEVHNNRVDGAHGSPSRLRTKSQVT